MTPAREPNGCQHKKTWFDRSISIRADGREGMADICSDCGKDMTRPKSEPFAKIEGSHGKWDLIVLGIPVRRESTFSWLRDRAEQLNAAHESAVKEETQKAVKAELSKHVCVCGQWTLRSEGLDIKCDGCGSTFVRDILMDEAVAAAREEEREACAKLSAEFEGGHWMGQARLAEAIRRRGEGK